MQKDIIEVHDSYKFNNGQIVAVLRTGEKALPGILVEDPSKKQWVIVKFYWTTGSIDTYQIIEEEQGQGIFQYILKGINHQEKPEKGSHLKIIGQCA